MADMFEMIPVRGCFTVLVLLFAVPFTAHAEEDPFNWTASTAATKVDMPLQFEGMTIDRNKLHLDPDAAADQRLRTARKLFNDRKYEEARKQYEKFLKTSTDTLQSCEARFESGLVLSRVQLFSQAAERWKDLALRPACPNAARALFQAGYVQLGLGQYDAALATYREILQRFSGGPEEQDARFLMIQCYFNKGDLPNADLQFLAFQKAYPHDRRLRLACQNLRSAHEINKKASDREALDRLICT